MHHFFDKKGTNAPDSCVDTHTHGCIYVRIYNPGVERRRIKKVTEYRERERVGRLLAVYNLLGWSVHVLLKIRRLVEELVQWWPNFPS